MAWTEPAYSRTKVNEAGLTYVDPEASAEEREVALVVINNWRSSHSFPLNTLQMGLRRVATDRDPDPTLAQRIKRLPSIRHKLQRIPGMDLARMQDIGGCRAVVSSVQAVEDVVDYYLRESQIKHRLIREDPYILHPKSSGYRGTHLIYAYYSDKTPTYQGLRIELQIRSRLQHAWATAVETVGTFTQQALKSSQGQGNWLRFDTMEQSLTVWTYPNTSAASDAYSALERATENVPERDVVLVSVESLDSLRRAYPNYFLDTTAFVEAVEEAIA